MQRVAAPAQELPHRLWVGVTGHRELAAREAVAARVREVLDRVVSGAGPRAELGVVSALAEGADRLVAAEVLARPGAVLEVALPLPAHEYAADFDTAASRDEFETLCARARTVTVVDAHDRLSGYAEVGRYVVEHTDVLIAVWDGRPAQGPGGTAEVVALARSRGVPLAWVASDGTATTWEGPEASPVQPPPGSD